MFVELRRSEGTLLAALVEARLRQLGKETSQGPDMPAVPSAPVATAVAHEREVLNDVLHRLHEAEFDVLC